MSITLEQPTKKESDLRGPGMIHIIDVSRSKEDELIGLCGARGRKSLGVGHIKTVDCVVCAQIWKNRVDNGLF